MLFAGFESTTLGGELTVAVLASEPVAPASTAAVTVYVNVPPKSTVTESLMLPEPLALQLEPTDAEQVQVTPVKTAGKMSVTVAPIASLGPLLVTVIVYVSTDSPGTAVV